MFQFIPAFDARQIHPKNGSICNPTLTSCQRCHFMTLSCNAALILVPAGLTLPVPYLSEASV